MNRLWLVQRRYLIDFDLNLWTRSCNNTSVPIQVVMEENFNYFMSAGATEKSLKYISSIIMLLNVVLELHVEVGVVNKWVWLL